MSDRNYYEIKTLDRVCQGNIYRDLSYIVESTKEDEFSRYIEDFAIVVSQDCDLKRDCKNRIECQEMTGKNHDKYLKNILFCPLYKYESFIKGEHLNRIKRSMRCFKSGEHDRLKTNQEFRFHYLEKCLDFQIPELIADFKHFFSINREIFYSKYHNPSHYLCSLSNLFREDISNRFTNYLARIALPEVTE